MSKPRDETCAKCGGQHRTEKHDLPRRMMESGGALVPCEGACVLIEACEQGYSCPNGHHDPDGNPVFSEFEAHLYCFECQDDFPTKDCPKKSGPPYDPPKRDGKQLAPPF